MQQHLQQQQQQQQQICVIESNRIKERDGKPQRKSESIVIFIHNCNNFFMRTGWFKLRLFASGFFMLFVATGFCSNALSLDIGDN